MAVKQYSGQPRGAVKKINELPPPGVQAANDQAFRDARDQEIAMKQFESKQAAVNPESQKEWTSDPVAEITGDTQLAAKEAAIKAAANVELQRALNNADARVQAADAAVGLPPEGHQTPPQGAVISSQQSAPVYQPGSQNQAPPPGPPSNRAEYNQQWQPIQGEYPEITDTFAGRAGPGMQPINRPQPIGPNPNINKRPPRSGPHVVTVEHKIPDQQLAYQFAHDCHIQLNGSFQSWKQGDIIYDTYLIEMIIESGFDGLIPYAAAGNFTTCPKCTHTFPLPHQGR